MIVLVSKLLGITPYPAISAILLLALTVAVLYLARSTAHQAIRAVSSALHSAFRLGATSVSQAETRLAARNREVLLAAGREAKERAIEREFERINNTVNKDLTTYPTLNRRLNEVIQSIEEDHQRAIEVPPDPPAWAKAVEAVAKIDSRQGIGAGNVLSDIHKSLVKAHEEAMVAYHAATAKRHDLLRNMVPHWRNIQQMLGQVNKNVESLLNRSITIDRHMSEYEDILRRSDRAVSILSSSALVYFFISAFVLAIAVGGAAINFSLIARPMAEMVGGTNFIGNFRTADIAALVIIMVEISMGLFLMESLRITRLFPVIGALPDKLRVRMLWITFGILIMLASIEAGLAYMREILLQDELATSALLRGDDALMLTSNDLWITTAAQMGMGFILPFALVFVAIPLETFVQSSRTVLGIMAMGFLSLLAATMRVLGNGCKHAGALAEQLYDLPLCLPLWLESRLQQRHRDHTGEKDIIVKATFEDRPSAANGQKRLFADHIDQFARNAESAPYTDITGGLLQAIEFLNEKNPGHKTIFIFSDLKEDLLSGYVRDIPLNLDGFDVVALNVTKLRSDNVDPREYLDRLKDWETQVVEGGGRWRVVNDLDHLEGLLKT